MRSPTREQDSEVERLRYASGWFCTNASCDYYLLTGEQC